MATAEQIKARHRWNQLGRQLKEDFPPRRMTEEENERYQANIRVLLGILPTLPGDYSGV